MLTAESAADLAAYAEGASKIYGRGQARVVALDAITLGVPKGRFTAIMGPSGSGKSTLMHCLAGLDQLSSGRVVLGGTDLTRLGERALTRLRRDRVGFVFQSYNLVPTLSAGENITLPADIAGRRVDPGWLAEIVEAMGLGDRLRHRPAELSGGQQQRVACARALAARPDVVFADEPTGNLDSRSGREVLALLRDSARRTGQSIVMVTHDPSAAAYADLVVFLADGAVAGQLADPEQSTVLERMKHLDPAQAEENADENAQNTEAARTRPDTACDGTGTGAARRAAADADTDAETRSRAAAGRDSGGSAL